MEQQFKVGDVVTIADLSIHSYVHYGVNDNMIRFSRKQATITKAFPNSYTPTRTDEDGCRYKIDLDHEVWIWSNMMFVANASSSPFKVSNEDFE